VTDGSDDKTVEIVKRYAGRGVELTHDPSRSGKMAAIERAMPSARGSIVVLSDGNNMFNSTALRELVIPFSDPQVGVVTGAKTILRGDGSLGESEGLYWRYESFIRMQESLLGFCTGVNGEIMAIRREAFEPLPYAGIGAIDFHLSLHIARRGYRILYAPNARSSERISPSAQDEKERRSRMIAGRYQAISMAHKLLPFNRPLVVWQIISHKFMRPLIPFAMIGALLANVLDVLWLKQTSGISFSIFQPTFSWIILGLQGMFYGLAWLGNWGSFPGKLGHLLYLPTFLVNSNLAAMAGLFRFLSGRQTPLWKRATRREVGLLEKDD
jgi:cellulose synthase/poly-beta-1,6-N-acetylglucosamine synthase-like glycosyltransferase